MFEKRIVIDCRGHLLGRLASVIAKELLNGQKIVCVRCEEINVSGSFARNKVKYLAFLRKRMNVNPKKGPIHFRAPSKILWRTIRGMLPHKTPRGAHALSRLTTYEGVPPPFDRRKRVVVPQALRVLRLAPGRSFILLKRLSTEFGWKHSQVIDRLEAKRKLKAKRWYLKTKALTSLRKKTVATTQNLLSKKRATFGETQSIADVLTKNGYRAN